MFVHKVDADVPCEAVYTDVGANHAHSVVCKLPSKQIVYCAVTADTWPICKPIDGSDAKPPRAPEPPQPADPPPAAPAPTAAPPKKGR
jgi:hypothetical protein